MSAPNRAKDPKRVIGSINKPMHYTVEHNTWAGVGSEASLSDLKTNWFSDKKSAMNHAKSVAKLGYQPFIRKHDPSSPDYGTEYKPAPLLQAKIDTYKFFQGH